MTTLEDLRLKGERLVLVGVCACVYTALYGRNHLCKHVFVSRIEMPHSISQPTHCTTPLACLVKLTCYIML